MRHVTGYSRVKTGEYFNDIPQFQFQDGACCEKYLKNNERNGRYLPQKYARTFFLGHYLFFKAQTVCFSERIIDGEKYPSKFPRQIKATVHLLKTESLDNAIGEFSLA